MCIIHYVYILSDLKQTVSTSFLIELLHRTMETSSNSIKIQAEFKSFYLYILRKFFDGITFWNYAWMKTKWFTRKPFLILNAVHHQGFFFFLFFLIRYKKIRIFKGNFQKHVLFLSVGLLRPRCFSVGTSIVLRDFNQMPGLMMKSEKSI